MDRGLWGMQGVSYSADSPLLSASTVHEALTEAYRLSVTLALKRAQLLRKPPVLLPKHFLVDLSLRQAIATLIASLVGNLPSI